MRFHVIFINVALLLGALQLLEAGLHVLVLRLFPSTRSVVVFQLVAADRSLSSAASSPAPAGLVPAAAAQSASFAHMSSGCTPTPRSVAFAAVSGTDRWPSLPSASDLQSAQTFPCSTPTLAAQQLAARSSSS